MKEENTERNSIGKTVIWIVVGIATYLAIQWLMPKVGMRSWLFGSGSSVDGQSESAAPTWGRSSKSKWGSSR